MYSFGKCLRNVEKKKKRLTNFVSTMFAILCTFISLLSKSVCVCICVRVSNFGNLYSNTSFLCVFNFECLHFYNSSKQSILKRKLPKENNVSV